MLPFIYFSGFIGAGLMGGGIVPYLLGIAGGAVAFYGIKRLWQQLNWAGKGLLMLGWIAVCYSGIVFKQMQGNDVSPATSAVGPSPSNPTSQMPVAGSSPPPGFVLDERSAQQSDPRDTFLQMHFEQLNDSQYSAAVDRWLEAHPDVSSAESRSALSQHLQEVYTQYPRSALGPALDMALNRGQKYASSPTTTALPSHCADYTSIVPPAKYRGARVSFNLQSVPLRSFLKLIEDEANRRIVPADDVSAAITACALNIPWDFALDKVLGDNGYGQTEYDGSIRVFKQ